jgi:RNA polymerase sigma-70 factor, ECF subfamily
MRSVDLTDCDDAVLLERARAGERAAFGELILRHQRAALRVAAVISGSTEEADDIVQDALISVHRRLGSYRGTGSVRSWLLRVVANHAKNHVRGSARRRRHDERQAGLALRTYESAEQSAVRHFEQRTLATALTALSLRDREVLGCRFVAGLTEAETADVLDIPAGTVKSRTARALTRLHHEVSRLDRTEALR